jgi:hypothetical protein
MRRVQTEGIVGKLPATLDVKSVETLGVIRVRGLISRIMRFEILMGLAAILTLALPVHATQSGIRTFTQMNVSTHEVAGVTVSEFTVRVSAADGESLTGSVTLEDGDKQLAGAALNDGVATFTQNLSAGSHLITAVYQDDEQHKASASAPQNIHPQPNAITNPTYAISLNPAALTLTAGDAGSSVVTITPSNNQGTTSPTFFTLSCSGLPADTTCYFTPENVQIPAGSNVAVTSSFTLQTQGESGPSSKSAFGSNKETLALAILLPGVFALGWLGRRRSAIVRLMMLSIVVLIAGFGFSGCAARYTYYNHGPPTNVATPSGNYTITITAQTSNGVTASNETTTLALTVN